MRRMPVTAVAALVFISIASSERARAQQNATPDAEFSDNPAGFLDYGGLDGECSKPIEARQGAWFCSNITPNAASLLAPQAQGAPTSDADVAAPDIAAAAETGGVCEIAGCWNYDKQSHVTAWFKGQGWYGFGGTFLGNIDISFQVVAGGNRQGKTLTVAPIWFKSSRGVKKLLIEVEVLYVSDAYPEGHPEGARHFKSYSKANVAPGSTVSFPRPYPIWRENLVKPTVIVEFTWWDPSFPGRWYSFAKSLEFLKNDDLDGAYFVTGYNLPLDHARAGWKEE